MGKIYPESPQQGTFLSYVSSYAEPDCDLWKDGNSVLALRMGNESDLRPLTPKKNLISLLGSVTVVLEITEKLKVTSG